MARPSHEPTEQSRKQVEAMAAYGVPETDLAHLLDIDPKTLRKHYRRELDTGHVRANARVAESLFRTAIKGGREGTVAAIFWMKVRAGWSEFNAPRLRPPSLREVAAQQAEVAASGTYATPPPPSTYRGEKPWEELVQ